MDMLEVVPNRFLRVVRTRIHEDHVPASTEPGDIASDMLWQLVMTFMPAYIHLY